MSIFHCTIRKIGHAVVFTRKGTGLNTRYPSAQLAEQYPLPEGLVDMVPRFKDIIIVPTVEEIQRALDAQIDIGNSTAKYEDGAAGYQSTGIDDDIAVDFGDFPGTAAAPVQPAVQVAPAQVAPVQPVAQPAAPTAIKDATGEKIREALAKREAAQQAAGS